MKKIISIVTLIAVLLCFTGCSGAKPDATVDTFLSAAQELDLETMATTIEDSNTEDLEEAMEMLNEDDQDDYIRYFLDYIKDNAKKMTYEITGSEVDEDKATVTVDCKYVDGGLLLKSTIGEVFPKILGMAFSGIEPTDEEIGQLFVSTMEEQAKLLDESFKEDTIKIDLVKQDKTWYITEITDDMLNVIMSGFITAVKDIDDSMDDAFGDFDDIFDDMFDDFD